MTAVDKKPNKKAEKSDGRSKSQLKAWMSHESLLSSTTLTLPSGKSKTTAANSNLYRSTLQRDYLSAEHSGSSLSLNIEVGQGTKNRMDNSLTISVAEAKNVTSKKKCFCEVYINDSAACKTTAKLNDNVLFWGEHFELKSLPAVQAVTIKLYELPDSKKKKDSRQLLGSVEIPSSDITCAQSVEKWYSLTTSSSLRRSPTSETVRLRVKARYQSVPILPTEMYDELVDFLKRQYKPMVEQLEPVISTKVKEGIGDSLVRVMIGLGFDLDFLTDVTMAEVNKIESTQLLFRSNSVATKSVEAYLKLYADKYIKQTLEDVIYSLIDMSGDCEVDPDRLTGKASLTDNQARLCEACQTAWWKILNSTPAFPKKLKMLFGRLRQSCGQVERGDVSDHLISACLFLRLICPAILAPNLFHITQDFPTVKAARTLTLVAKTMQTLANFSEFGAKEEYMTFMNNFIQRESPHMKTFLQLISDDSQSDHEASRDDTPPIDVDLELSVFHAKLSDALSKVDGKPESILESASLPTINALETLTRILADINAYAKNPELYYRKRSSISQPTPLTSAAPTSLPAPSSSPASSPSVSLSAPSLQSPSPLVPSSPSIGHSSPMLEQRSHPRPAGDVEFVHIDPQMCDIKLNCTPPTPTIQQHAIQWENKNETDSGLLIDRPDAVNEVGQATSLNTAVCEMDTLGQEQQRLEEAAVVSDNDSKATVEESWRQMVNAADSSRVDHVTLVTFNEDHHDPSFPPSWTSVSYSACDSLSSNSNAWETDNAKVTIENVTTPPLNRVITITRNGTSDFNNDLPTTLELPVLLQLSTGGGYKSSRTHREDASSRQRSSTLPNNNRYNIVETLEESLSSSISFSRADNDSSPVSVTPVTPMTPPVAPARTHRHHQQQQQQQQQETVVARTDVINTQSPTITVSVSMQLHDELALKSAALRVTESRDRWPGAILASSSAITEPEFV